MKEKEMLLKVNMFMEKCIGNCFDCLNLSILTR